MRFLRLILGLALALAALGMLFWGCSESESKNPTDGGNGGGSVFDTSFVASHVSADAFDLIADSSLATATSSFEIYYGHTSHGSQIMSGLDLLENEGAISSQPTVHEVSDDLGHNGDTSWVPLTRSYLNTHPECNMAMWSWCGGCSDNTEQGINTYLSAMSALEAAYPNVIFVYMTGHLDGTGVNGNLYARNNQIRAYCEANDKVLFDFADMQLVRDLVPDQRLRLVWVCSFALLQLLS